MDSLTLCPLGNFHSFFFFLSFADFFQNQLFLKDSLGPGQAQRSVRPGLGPNCLQKLSADDTMR